MSDYIYPKKGERGFRPCEFVRIEKGRKPKYDVVIGRYTDFTYLKMKIPHNYEFRFYKKDVEIISRREHRKRCKERRELREQMMYDRIGLKRYNPNLAYRFIMKLLRYLRIIK